MKNSQDRTGAGKILPVVRLKPTSYQPSKAELEKPIALPGNPTPEGVAKALVRHVRVVYQDQ